MSETPLVRARVMSIGVGRLEVEPEEFIPDTPVWFCVTCTVNFGNTAGPGMNYHTLVLCSPSWLADSLPSDAVLRGQGLLVMRQYDGKLLREALDAFAYACTATDVDQLYRKLERLGFSEFEDYNEPPLSQYFIDRAHQHDGLWSTERYP